MTLLERHATNWTGISRIAEPVSSRFQTAAVSHISRVGFEARFQTVISEKFLNRFPVVSEPQFQTGFESVPNRGFKPVRNRFRVEISEENV